MYSVILSLRKQELAEIELKSITKVCRLLETVNFDLCDVEIIRDNGSTIDPDELMEVWFYEKIPINGGYDDKVSF